MTTKPDFDPRKGLPSASGAKRRKNCKGSFALERTVPPEMVPRHDPHKTGSAEGELLHSAWESDDSSRLNEDQLITYYVGCGLRAEVIGIAQANGLSGWYSDWKEYRLWLKVDGEERLSCRFDWLIVSEDNTFAVVNDWKGGWLGAGDASDNDQLRETAVIVFQNFPSLDKIMVTLLQPRLGEGERFTYRIYTREELVVLTEEVIKHLDEIETPGMPLAIGDWCKYCDAILICPRQRETIEQISSVTNESTKIEVLPSARELSLYSGVEKHIEMRRAAAKSMLAKDPDAIPGVILAPAQVMRILHPVRCAEALLSCSFQGTRLIESREELLQCSKMQIGLVEELIKNKTGLKGKELAEAVETIIGEAITRKEKARALKIL